MVDKISFFTVAHYLYVSEYYKILFHVFYYKYRFNFLHKIALFFSQRGSFEQKLQHTYETHPEKFTRIELKYLQKEKLLVANNVALINNIVSLFYFC